jgi:hypothetical protein
MASSHRVGHYAGLHPEDQPYQSSLMEARHLADRETTRRDMLQSEPEHIVLPPAAPPVQSLQPARRDSIVDQPTRSFVSRLPVLPARVISGLLTMSCIMFLLAGGIFALVLVGHHTMVATSAVWASPTTVRSNAIFTFAGKGFAAHTLLIFTHDTNQTLIDANGQSLEAHTDATGGFMLHIRVPHTWRAGIHSLHATDEVQKLSASTHIIVQRPPTTPATPTARPLSSPSVQPATLGLSTTTLSYSTISANNPDDQTVTLQNSGGQTLAWSATSSTGNGPAWLAVTPASGYLAPHTSTLVSVHVDAQHLLAGTYRGLIDFSGGANAQIAVTCVVAGPGYLAVSPLALHSTVTQGQSAPLVKTLTLQNSGGAALQWSASSSTADHGTWLAAAPAKGQLSVGATAALALHIDARTLAVGTYQGMVTLISSNKQTIQVSMTLTVTPPAIAVLGVSRSTLSFTGSQGSNPASQTLRLTNTGTAPLNWQVNEDGGDKGGNSALNITPSRGSLDSGASILLHVAPDVAAAAPGTVTTAILCSDTDPDTQVHSVRIPVTITVSPR